MTMPRICLITGSTQGIGLSAAEKLGLQGHHVIISSRREENSMRAEQLLKENNITYDYFLCNFECREQRLQLVKFIKEKFGKLDSLVCTISSNPYSGESLSINEKEFDKIFQINVKNTFFTIVDFLELLRKGDNSSIVMLSSSSGYVPFPYLGVYSISKSAIFMMTKVLSQELACFNIRVNCVASGLVKTKFTNSNVFNKFSEKSFMRRMAMPHEVAGAITFLCSREASYITGETISINGGSYGRL